MLTLQLKSNRKGGELNYKDSKTIIALTISTVRSIEYLLFGGEK